MRPPHRGERSEGLEGRPGEGNSVTMRGGGRAVIASIINGRRLCQARVSLLREDGGL